MKTTKKSALAIVKRTPIVKTTKVVKKAPKVKAIEPVKKINSTYIVGEFSNANGEKKQIARNVIVNAIKLSNVLTGTILSLPSYTLFIELMLEKLVSRKYSFIGCEREEKVYFRMLKNIIKNKLKMSTYFGSISEKIMQAKENEYSHLILDYCGQLTTFSDEIIYAIKNNIVKVNGVIAVTLCERSNPYDTMLAKIRNLKPSDENSNSSQDAIVTYFTKVSGFNYRIESVTRYRDTQAMILVILKRVE